MKKHGVKLAVWDSAQELKAIQKLVPVAVAGRLKAVAEQLLAKG